jgi:uncharacterized protein with PQ loop repeat
MDAEIIGWTGATVSIIGLGSQAYVLFRKNTTEGLSVVRSCTDVVCILIWWVYGFAIDSKPIYITNSIQIVISLSIIGLIVRTKMRDGGCVGCCRRRGFAKQIDVSGSVPEVVVVTDSKPPDTKSADEW